MALRQISTIANPQPGTTNTPFPAGPVPAFVPVTTTIVDTDAEAITARTLALTTKLHQIEVTLYWMNANIANLIAQQRDIDKQIADVDAAILAYAATISSKAKVTSMEAASNIQKNNFSKAIIDDGTVKVPTKEDQLKKTVIEGIFLKEAAYTTGALTSFIIDQFRKANDWLLATETYKTVKGWVQKQLEGFYTWLTQEITPTSPYVVTTTEAAATRTKVVT